MAKIRKNPIDVNAIYGSYEVEPAPGDIPTGTCMVVCKDCGALHYHIIYPDHDESLGSTCQCLTCLAKE